MQQAGGGWSGDVDILDAIHMTNAQESSELYTKRVSANEISVEKDSKGNFVYPILQEGWAQPLDGFRMTKRIQKAYIFEYQS